MDERKPRISTEGQLYITLAAAEQWHRANDFRGIEEARRDLTETLLEAYRYGDPANGMIRYKSHSQRLMLEAHVSVEGRLLVVRRINIRTYERGGGGPASPKRRIVR